MYSYLNGELAELTPLIAVIDCGGVGYEVEIPLSTYDKIKGQKRVKLLIHRHQNDDGVRLFGFFSIEEKQLFRKLISITRVGPKIGLSMLSSLPVITIVNAIVSEDHKLLARTPGLGSKTAQRLIIELKDKITEINVSSTESTLLATTDITEEAENALLSLGYKQLDIRKAFKFLLKENKSLSVEDLIKKTIKYLYQKG